ncbi:MULTISPECIES: alpha/beta fold hydrolase [unclassified Ruegeria]|uniref:alpha/beta fold hydrolase n=1 Tax=unclassified Ruegeria TaxID=2625375 RepID=UPI0014886DD5|nr:MULTISPECIES: alpha/beta hydrolase [unclassified Ruegeria]NOD62859.1 alpha/beta fold hydrolase [Ruegeria sp. HKCCD6109]
MHTSFADLNGQSFCLRTWGEPDAPPLLMLHGFPEYGGAWADLAPYLADRFYCIAPDQRGYGQSWCPEGVQDYTLSQLVSDMATLIETHGAPFAVLGHDWGASVAYGLAMFRPDLVDRLIIANGVHPVPFQRAMAAGGAQSEASQYINQLRAPEAAQKLSENNFALLERFFRHGMGLDWLTESRMAEYRAEWARPGRLEAMLNWYRASPLVVAQPGLPATDLPDLPLDRLHVRCPHLLLWGPDDKALLPEATEGLETFAPNLTRITIPGTDHWLHHQIPQDVAQAIQEWIQTA